MNLRAAFHIALLCASCTATRSADLNIQFVGVDGKGISGTVVVLRSTDRSQPLAKPVDATMDQQDRSFVPHVLTVPVGSRIRFPNSDSVSHQVYSFSAAKRFQLPLYRGQLHPPVAFDRAGVVTLGCNIHDQMRAYVYVVEGQHYGRTDATGNWKIDSIQPDSYTVQIWHPLARESRPLVDQVIQVREGSAPVILRASAPIRLRNESSVPANWDAY
jgi:plastocyanin